MSKYIESCRTKSIQEFYVMLVICMGDFKPQQIYAGTGTNPNFVIAVNFILEIKLSEFFFMLIINKTRLGLKCSALKRL